jgi:hypothetical protein
MKHPYDIGTPVTVSDPYVSAVDGFVTKHCGPSTLSDAEVESFTFEERCELWPPHGIRPTGGFEATGWYLIVVPGKGLWEAPPFFVRPRVN